jgi:hypothetical protein
METINTIPVNYDSSDSLKKSSKKEVVSKPVSLPFLDEENTSNIDPNTIFKTDKQIGKGFVPCDFHFIYFAKGLWKDLQSYQFDYK